MNFYESNSYIWFLGRFYGLFYFTHDQGVLKITRKSFFISILPACVFVAILVVAVFTVRASNDEVSATIGDKTTAVLVVVSVFGIVSQFSNCFVILIVAYNKREKVLNFYKTVNKLDAIFENKLNIYFDYEKKKRKDFWKLFNLTGFYLLTFVVISYAYTVNYTYISIMFLSIFTYGSDLFTSIDYYYSIKIIQKRFKSLNKLFTGSSSITLNKLEIMIESHFILNQLIAEMNQIHGFKKLFNITNDFLFIITQLYAIFTTIDEKELKVMYMKVLLGLMVTPVLIVKIVLTANCCEKTVACKKKFGKLLKGMDHFECNGSVSDLVYNFTFFSFNYLFNSRYFRFTILEYLSFIQKMLNLQQMISFQLIQLCFLQ